MSKTARIAIAVLAVAAIGGYHYFRTRSAHRPSDHKLVALVYLLKEPRHMSEADVRQAAARAFGATFNQNNPHAKEFVLTLPTPHVKGVEEGSARSFMVKVGGQLLLVNDFSAPYMHDQATFAARIPDARVRKVVASHRAWISLDFMGKVDDEERKAGAYRSIGKMIAELAGPDCLAIFCPELERCNQFDGKLLATLRSDKPLTLFETPTFPPVIDVKSDDPQMVKAVAEARRRWPEFVAAFQASRDRGKRFIVKAEFKEADKSEFMWVSVTQIDGPTIHGILENRPNELTNVKEGQEVVVPVSGLNDWLFVQGKQPVGGFTIKVVQDIADGK